MLKIRYFLDVYRFYRWIGNGFAHSIAAAHFVAWHRSRGIA
jgi:hypothetical protein